MNSVQKNELTFHNVTFNQVSHENQIWLTSSELAKALGYKKSDAVTQIYSRYHDEFTESMSTTLKMSVVRKTGAVDIPVRVFSLRGAHLISMFANTPVAKEFRRWVLDILDREVTQGRIYPSFAFDMHARNARVANEHIRHIYNVWRENLSPALRGVGSPIARNLEDRFKAIGAITFGLANALSKQEKNGKIH
ncbi:TPA: Bro-N domain-containing protein [Salmonella enterica subsp. diarizonae serovar 61:l,v:z35]